MQEVVKRMQERQDKKESPKVPVYYELCLVKLATDMVPVYLPSDFYSANVGDWVFFPYEDGTEFQAEIVFAEYCEADSPIWTAVTVATQMAPIRATKFMRSPKIVEWKEEE